MSSLAFSASSSQAVFTAEELHAEAVRLELPPSRPTLRRVRRAIEIVNSDAVHFEKHTDAGRLYTVQSQSSDESYTVTVPSVDLPLSPDECSCTCPDSAHKQNTCKHAIAAIMLEELERDRPLAAHEDARHLVDPSLSHLMPDSYERLLMSRQ